MALPFSFVGSNIHLSLGLIMSPVYNSLFFRYPTTLISLSLLVLYWKSGYAFPSSTMPSHNLLPSQMLNTRFPSYTVPQQLSESTWEKKIRDLFILKSFIFLKLNYMNNFTKFNYQFKKNHPPLPNHISSVAFPQFLPRSRKRLGLSFTHWKVRWLEFCYENTLPLTPVQESPLLHGVNLPNNCSLFSGTCLGYNIKLSNTPFSSDSTFFISLCLMCHFSFTHYQ